MPGRGSEPKGQCSVCLQISLGLDNFAVSVVSSRRAPATTCPYLHRLRVFVYKLVLNDFFHPKFSSHLSLGSPCSQITGFQHLYLCGLS